MRCEQQPPKGKRKTHPDEIRALLPAGSGNVRLPIWSPLIDRKQLLTLANATKKLGVIPALPNVAQLFPSDIRTGFATGTLEASIRKGVAVRFAGFLLIFILHPGSRRLAAASGVGLRLRMRRL